LTLLRIGLIGAGEISLYHLRAWQRVAGVEVVAICDRDISRAQARAEEFGIPHVFADAGAMLDAQPLDAVEVLTWRDTHVELVRLAASRGCHVLCQKPLAPSLAEAEALLAGLGGHIRLMVNENRRFAPLFRQAGAWIAEGRLGEARQCHLITNRSGFLPGADGVRPAVRRSPRMGTEPRLLIAETFIHQIDVLRCLLGPLALVAARALRTEPDMPGETLATLLMETPSGAPVVLSGSYVAPGFGTGLADRLEIIGSRDSLVLDGSGLRLMSAAVGPVPEPPDSYQACFDTAAAHFAACLRSGAPFESEPADNLETLRLVEEAYRLAAR
jgi:predicted dehydrogenase